MLKNRTKNLIEILFRVINPIFGYNQIVKRSGYKTVLYSLWLKPSFKSCGVSLRIARPLFLVGSQFVEIGDNLIALSELRIECFVTNKDKLNSPIVKIGNNVRIMFRCHIGCINKIIIGNNVLLGSNVLIIDHQHGYVDWRDLKISPTSREIVSAGPIVIEDDVWIGENACIMPGVFLGRGCVVGANSVVTKSFPPNSVICGIPAKIIRSLSEMIDK